MERLVKNKGWDKMGFDDKIKSINEFVTREHRYAFDVSENWQFPVVTYFRRRGDCEDTTILFVTLARIAGVTADRIFNVVGYMKRYNGERVLHSYPIVKMKDGKWYIFETTLTSPSKPKLFKGSRYTADYGVSNWMFKGGLKEGLQV